jgi:hypothetical protein
VGTEEEGPKTYYILRRICQTPRCSESTTGRLIQKADKRAKNLDLCTRHKVNLLKFYGSQFVEVPVTLMNGRLVVVPEEK